MKLPILASCIMFIGVLSLYINRENRKIKSQEDEFWEKENKANNVRKKSLADLPYVSFSMKQLPVNADQSNPIIAQCQETLMVLSEQKMVCLSGITNTDLKLMYGTANITALSDYDENFTVLVTTLQKWAQTLYDDQYMEEAIQVLEYAISLGSDVGTSYRLLASLYSDQGNQDGIVSLYVQALNLSSPSGVIIAKSLKTTYPEIL